MKQRSWKKALWTMLCMAFLCTFWTMTVQAASVTELCTYSSKKTVFSKDITGDGKADRIAVIPKKNKDNYVSRIQVYINGKKALDQNTNCISYGVTVKYIYMSKNRTFLQIHTHGDSSYVGYNGIFKSNKKGTKLTCVLDLGNFCIDGGEVISATAKEIKVRFTEQPGETGWLFWNFTYKYTGSKFKLKSNTASIKSSLTRGTDACSKLLKQNKFRAMKSLTFYKKTDLRTVSFTAKDGDILTLKKVKINNGYMYLQFKKGSKTGWQRVKQGINWFYGITGKLAG